jgi:hypothetical protein
MPGPGRLPNSYYRNTWLGLSVEALAPAALSCILNPQPTGYALLKSLSHSIPCFSTASYITEN